MRTILLAIVIGLSIFVVATTDQSEPPVPTLRPSQHVADEIEINFPEVQLAFADVSADDFKVTIKGDTAFIQSVGFPQIDGAKLNIKSNKLKSIRARIQFGFGVLQYLTDDRPASPLDFSWQLGWRRIEAKDNVILIPQYYQNRENLIGVFEFLGFTDKSDFEGIFQQEHFAAIKPISYRTQKEHFAKLLAERDRYEKCCPEYIDQANEFLKKRPGDLKSFSDLGVEIYLSDLELQISGINAEGKQETYTLTNIRK